MKNSIIFLYLFILFITINILYGQMIKTRGRFTHSIYSYEDKTAHTKLYQTLLTEIKSNSPYHFRLNLALRVLTDLNQNMDKDRRLNAYQLSFAADGLFKKLIDLEIGRQLLHPGLPLGSVDGINLNMHINKNVNWQIFGGIESNIFRSLDFNSNNTRIYGSSIFYQMQQRNFKAVFLNKIRNSKNQWQIGGLNISEHSIKDLHFQLQAHYDMINQRMHRIYCTTYYTGLKKIQFNLFFKEQYPQIYQGSFFKRFQINKYRQTGVSSNYQFSNEYYLTGGYRYLEITNGKAQLIDFIFGNKNGSLGIIYETGKLGDQTSFLIDYCYQFSPYLFALAAVDYTRYRLEEVYNFEKQLANTIRISYKAKKHWMIDLEYQWLNNRYMVYDHRILNHIHFIW